MRYSRILVVIGLLALVFGTGIAIGARMVSKPRVANEVLDDAAHWLSGVWISTTTPPSTLVFLPNQTFVEYIPGYSGSFPTAYRISPEMSFEADYPRGEEGEASTNRSQFELSAAGQLLFVPEGALTTKATKFKRLTSADPWVAGQDPPQ